jgi:bacteriophage integrase
MATITSYKNNKGTFFKVKGYLGVDPMTGKQVNINKGGFNTKKDANNYLRKASLDLENNKYLVSKKEKKNTYQEAYEEWLEIYRNNVKESTLHKTMVVFRDHIIPKFGKYKINLITINTLQKQAYEWHSKYKNYKKMINYTFAVFNYAHRMGYISSNPKDKFIMPKKVQEQQNEDLKYYTKEELITLFKHLEKDATNEWFTFFRLLAYTGIRKGECLALTWNDIDFKNNTLTVNKTISVGLNNKQIIQDPKSFNSFRTISIDTNTMMILKKWKTEQASMLLKFGHNSMNKNQLLFSTASSNKMYTLSKPRTVLKKVCDKNNFKFIHIHGFRHTHASLLFESGVTMESVKERLGHSDIQTTVNIYTHITQKNKDKTAKKFANYMGI